MRKWLIMVLLAPVLLSCGQLNPQIVNMDRKNYEANKVLAAETLKTWSFNSGFISCAGLLTIKFPITTAQEARQIFQSPQIALSVIEMDELAKKRGVWSAEDYDLGCSLGLRARATGLIALDIAKLFPTLAPYLGGLF